MAEDHTLKFLRIKAALIEFLTKEQVMLAPSMYDNIQLWPLEKGDDPIYGDCLVNRLGPEAQRDKPE